MWDIYVLQERQSRSPDEMAAAYPHLTLADVHAALAYYWDNKDEIDRQMKGADEFVEQFKAASGPSPLERKLGPWDRAVIRFHLGENVDHAIAHGLRLRGVDVTTATNADLIAATDPEHITFAVAENRVIFPQDQDFLRHHSAGD